MKNTLKRNLPPSFDAILKVLISIPWVAIFAKIKQIKESMAFLFCIAKWATDEQKKAIADIYIECLKKKLESTS